MAEPCRLEPGGQGHGHGHRHTHTFPQPWCAHSHHTEWELRPFGAPPCCRSPPRGPQEPALSPPPSHLCRAPEPLQSRACPRASDAPEQGQSHAAGTKPDTMAPQQITPPYTSDHPSAPTRGFPLPGCRTLWCRARPAAHGRQHRCSSLPINQRRFFLAPAIPAMRPEPGLTRRTAAAAKPPRHLL